MQPEHQQLIVNDLAVTPRPGEREIYKKQCSMTHHERPNTSNNGGNAHE